MTELDIACRRSADGDGWTCDVTIDVEGGASTRHVVTVAAADLERLDPGARDPQLLVDRSFRFLLERESPRSILRVVRPDDDRPLLPGVRRDDRPSWDRSLQLIKSRVEGGRPDTVGTSTLKSDRCHRSSPGSKAAMPKQSRLRPRIRSLSPITIVRVGPRVRQTAIPSGRMCEHFVARAAEPFRLDELWPFTERLERYGIAGFGWGAAWLQPDGTLCSHRDIRAFLRRPRPRGRRAVRRRPPRSSTSGGPRSCRRSASPTPSRSTTRRAASSFSHNGDLREIARGVGGTGTRAASTAGPTPRSARAGSRTRGTAGPRSPLLAELHDEFGGQANLATIDAAGDVAAYAGNTENPVFTFRLGRIGLASTGIYSLDRSLFSFVAPDATERGLVRVMHGVALDRTGAAVPAS